MLVGLEQRVFKTSTLSANLNSASDQLINFKNLQNDIFYGDYSTTQITMAKISNTVVSNYLINFHEINADYILNRPDKNKILTINTAASWWFNTSAYNSQFDEQKNKQERISFFPQYINTPIDITYSRNNSYFLLPISTQRYVNIVQPDILLKYRKQGPKAVLKPHYTEMFQQQWSIPYTSSEDTSIPIYDLNFSFLQTINLNTNKNVQDFLKKYNLLDYKLYSNVGDYALSSTLIYNSETNRLDSQTGTCILMKPFLEFLIKNTYLFNLDKCKEIIQDLISNLDIDAMVRLLFPAGNITKLSNETINSFINDEILSADFNVQVSSNIFDYFNTQPYFIQTPEVFPQNVLLNSDVRYPLQYSINKYQTIRNEESNHNEIVRYNREELPSAYFNILYLKNFRNPHYEFDLTISSNIDENGKTKLFDYNISASTNDLGSNILKNDSITSSITVNHSADRNIGVNTNFDLDITRSLEAQTFRVADENGKEICFPNKSVTKELVEYAKNRDSELALSDSSYQGQFPDRMISKTKNYLLPFKNAHVCNNKVYNIGELHGIRNYFKVRKYCRFR